MQEAQRTVFQRLYWTPVLAQAEAVGVSLPLSLLALYDLAIHSGPGRLAKLRPRFPEWPPSLGGEERLWTRALLQARHDWLTLHRSAVIRRTTYRTAALLELVEQGRWQLSTPLTVRGVRVG